jgi:hypothetical protein
MTRKKTTSEEEIDKSLSKWPRSLLKKKELQTHQT